MKLLANYLLHAFNELISLCSNQSSLPLAWEFHPFSIFFIILPETKAYFILPFLLPDAFLFCLSSIKHLLSDTHYMSMVGYYNRYV
jgi:hypothetical protein